MVHENEVREKLSALLRGEISLLQFEDWLASASWSMHRDSNPSAIALVSSIDVLLSERDDHAINELELRNELRSLNEPRPVIASTDLILWGDIDQILIPSNAVEVQGSRIEDNQHIDFIEEFKFDPVWGAEYQPSLLACIQL